MSNLIYNKFRLDAVNHKTLNDLCDAVGINVASYVRQAVHKAMVDGFTLPKADKREDTSTQIRLTKVCDDFVDKLANETNHTKQEVLEAIVTKAIRTK